jgi:hypothetical protein
MFSIFLVRLYTVYTGKKFSFILEHCVLPTFGLQQILLIHEVMTTAKSGGDTPDWDDEGGKRNIKWCFTR